MNVDEIRRRQEGLFRWVERAFQEPGGPHEGDVECALLMAALLRDLQDHHYAQADAKQG